MTGQKRWQVPNSSESVGKYWHVLLLNGGGGAGLEKKLPTFAGSKVVVGEWSFTSRQQPRSYRDGNRLMAVHTHGNFILLPLWETRPPTPCPNIPQRTSPCLILIMPSARLGRDKYQFYKSLVWLDREQQTTWSRTRDAHNILIRHPHPVLSLWNPKLPMLPV